MSDIAISLENISKSYILSHNHSTAERYTALRDLPARYARSLARATKNIMTGQRIVLGDEVEKFWALKNISFEVKHGDRIGIIGRNGAGKSTLLKILSRITEPSTGRIKVAGRVASLLEVGTGFHPELTGRENIYLNGAVLGMQRKEIQKKFDEIVDFAEVEKFLDTPVKRYSSGMYVRLAFAVAAHLEPEILVIDEVLAVGDSQFQKKCLGKLEEVGKHGRTVLFVSHNMAMISSLCDKAVQLESGELRAFGSCDSVIRSYATSGEASPASLNFRNNKAHIGDKYARLLAASVRNAQVGPVFEVEINCPFSVRMEYEVLMESDRIFVPNFHFYRSDGTCAFIAISQNIQKLSPGEYAAECHIPPNFLNDGLYSIRIALSSFQSGVSIHFDEKSAITFNVRDPIDGVATRAAGYCGPIPGSIRPLLHWTLDAAD